MTRALLLACLFSTFASAQALLPSELPAELVRGLSATQVDTALNGLRLAGAPDCETAADCLKASLQNLRIATQLAREARTADQIAAAIGLPAPETQPEEPRRYELSVPKWAPSRGNAKAPITLVTWLDYQCPFSRRLQETLRQVEEKYPGRVRFVVRHLPLAFHSDARALAAMSLQAQDKGRFWEFHDRSLRSPRPAEGRSSRWPLS